MSPEENIVPGGPAPRPLEAPDAGTRTATAPLQALFDLLGASHQEIDRRLERLSNLATTLVLDGMTRASRAESRAALAWFQQTAGPHHLDEEQRVFPALLASGDRPLIERTRRLIQDHAWLEADWQQIAPSLQAAAEGRDGFEPVVLRHTVDVFVQLYRDHMAREETLAYPEARLRLGPWAQAEPSSLRPAR